MKTTNILRITSTICLLGWSQAMAQFSSGSTGADGPLNVTSDMTLNLPTDGIFNFTTITVSNAATLRFNRNLLNTPVYLLAKGDVVISGNIIVDGANAGIPAFSSAGKGGIGGFDGGFGSVQGLASGDGQGPGGGLASGNVNGVFGAPNSGSSTNVYGNTLLVPLVGGSGGGARSGRSDGGGGGGGAILIASSTRVITTAGGGIYARGGDASLLSGAGGSGGGSGGAIRIVAPVVEGTGEINTLGGRGLLGVIVPAGNGRTRIDALDRFAWRSLNLQNAGKWTTGTQMFVFPAGNPKLDIINAAGTAIPVGTSAPVIVNLPVGSSTNQLVRVQATGFTNDVSIRVKITPENAPSGTFDGVIQQSSGNPPFANVQVTLPVDTVCHVHAWTR